MANVMGYFQVPTAPAAPAAPPVPALPTMAGALPGTVTTTTTATTWDTWKPTSNSDPYVSGMRTSASAVAAVGGAAGSAANIRFANYSTWKAAGARVSAKAAARTGRTIGVAQKTTKAMSMAKSSSQKAAFLSNIDKGPKTAGIGAAFRYSFFSLTNIGKALMSSALVSVPIALVTNFMDWKAGRVTADQRNALMVADSIGYTVTGATSTLTGAAIGSTFLGPGVGTVAGIAAGFALGWVYEKFIRPRWGEMVHNAMYHTTTTVTPTPVIPTPPPVNMEPH